MSSWVRNMAGVALISIGNDQFTLAAEEKVKDNLECISELTLPRYSFIAKREQVPGTVEALILVGKDGQASRVIYSGGKWLVKEVDLTLKTSVKYRPDCEGRTIKVKFTFVLRREPEMDPPTWVYFKGPNEFVVESAMDLPTVQVVPVPKKP